MSSRSYAQALIILSALASLVTGPGSVTAQTNHCLAFDGVDDVVVVPDPVNAASALTIEAWVKVANATDHGRIVANRSGSTGYDLDVSDSGSGANLRLALNGGISLSIPFDAYMGTWTHVAATWGGPGSQRTRVYVNGAMITQNSAAGDLVASAGLLRIGRMVVNHFDGSIDEVRIWNAELDEATLSSWMHRGLQDTHPQWGSLLGAWSFDEGAGQVAASLVNSPALDGTLGLSTGVESRDPSWDTGAAPLPVERKSFGAIKGTYRD